MEKQGRDGETLAELCCHYLSIFTDVIKELPSGDVLHYHEDVRRGANDLVPADKTQEQHHAAEQLEMLQDRQQQDFYFIASTKATGCVFTSCFQTHT